MSHTTDGMNEISVIEIFKPVLIQVVSVGPTMELMSRGVFNLILVMSIL